MYVEAENKISQQPSKKSIRRKAILGILISAVAIVIIFHFTETKVTWKAILRANVYYLILAFLLQFLFWMFWAVRIQYLTHYVGKKISLKYAFEVTLASGFLAAITPSSAGGEPIRVKMLYDAGVGAGESTAVVLVERILDAIFFTVALPVFVMFTGFSIKLGMEISCIFGFSLFMFLVFLWILLKKPDRLENLSYKLEKLVGRFSKRRSEGLAEKLKEELTAFREALAILAKNSKCALISLCVTVMIWMPEFLIPSAILAAFGCKPYFLYSITAQLLLIVISLLPLTPGASGIAEFGMSYLYSKFIPQHIIGILTALWRVMTYYLNILAGFFVIKRKYVDEI
ncbi:MAG: hypothetical protein DSY33_00180 [Archaeoglobus sp.]|jgi:uncharacterized protein (TIRG00374 family)|nr:MAG: hypothetical protein DSY33_00180 [Archaeoglobus sp.]